MTHTPHRLEVININIGYGDKIVLRDVSFQIPARRACGSGRSQRRWEIHPVQGAGRAAASEIREDPHPRIGTRHFIKDCVAYVPQREEVDWKFPVTVSDVVMMGRYGKLGWLKRPSRADQAVVGESLTQLGIADLEKKSIGDLSGGQQQRVFLARALAQEPHILLMDEPFTGVDITTQEATLNLLDNLRERSVTAIISTHDLNLAANRFRFHPAAEQTRDRLWPACEVMRQENLAGAFGNSLLVMENGSHAGGRMLPAR